MKKSKGFAFWFGFLVAFVVGMAVWYWQKSTSADEGALDLLDELAKAKARIRELQRSGGQKETAVPTHIDIAQRSTGVQAHAPTQPDDLTAIRGIGPVYARRLQNAGIATFAALAAQEPEKIGQIVQIKMWQAASPAEWIAQAKALSNLS